MKRCDRCDEATGTVPVARYFDPVNPTDETWEALCDRCEAPREALEDYAAPFTMPEDEREAFELEMIEYAAGLDVWEDFELEEDHPAAATEEEGIR